MGWLSISQLTELTAKKITHRILQTNKPELMAQLMADNRTISHTTRALQHHKLGPIPRQLGRTAITRAIYRYRAYGLYSKLPTQITTIVRKKQFANRAKRFAKNSQDIPPDHAPHLP
jgi:hypothetical protein